MTRREILNILKLEDPLKDFMPNKEAKLWGWNGTGPVFESLIREINPKLIIEVGSWLGQSTSTMAQALKQNGLSDSSIIAVDTWLGSQEHWENSEFLANLKLKHGYPNIYYDFLSNMVNVSSADMIVPLPLPSAVAAPFLKEKNIRAELIYIDGSHTAKDVYDDITAYWELLAPGGILFGDDWTLDAVKEAVSRFSKEKDLDPEKSDHIWRIKKLLN